MNWLDFAIIAVVASFVLVAYSAGLIREVVTLVAIISGIVIAGVLYDDLAADVLVFIKNRDVGLAASFLILFGSVYLLGLITAYILKKGASLLMLGWADRVGGAFFGFVKGLVLVEVLLLVFAAYPGLGLDSAVDGSTLAPFFVDDVDVVLNLLPPDFDQRVDIHRAS
jgi:membrane protein required for colicin V production